eukprot:gene5962-6906_t
MEANYDEEYDYEEYDEDLDEEGERKPTPAQLEALENVKNIKGWSNKIDYMLEQGHLSREYQHLDINMKV